MSVLRKTWLVKNTDTEKTLIERLFKNRNLADEKDIDYFFHTDYVKGLYDPLLLKGMKEALERIDRALKEKERVIVFGDYDVDGITSTAILFTTLKELGANISYRLPDRQSDGYGLNERFIEEFKEKEVKLVITVDCGIANSEEIEKAKNYGIDVIITDHHAMPTEDRFPRQAYAIIHPKQEGCPYPFKEITGAGVAFKLSQALFTRHKKKKGFEKFFDLAALGTVADCAPLIDENRLIVKGGLKMLKNTQNLGLKHLKNIAGIDENRRMSTETLSFLLAPRINAAGRIAHPYYALQMILAEDEKALQFAQKLEKLNQERQRITGLAMEEVEKKFGKSPEKKNILVAYDSNWSSGIIGLIAGKMEERYARPCVIMEDRGDTLVGSIRSPEFFSSIQLLNQCKEYLDRFGGHEQAGGFNISKKNLAAFLEKITKVADESLRGKEIKNILSIDSEIIPAEIDMATLEEIEAFEPFGIGNERPTFLLKDVPVHGIRPMGNEKKHLSFGAYLGDHDIRCFGFHLGPMALRLHEGIHLDIVCHLERNEWNGNTKVELKMIDFAVAK
ncbi:single-stranded-DNA-specific exonuclease RecJ [Candidatus Peregrinibacteria bacterium]|nr:single-stranded-DNA-specific exonuclease RecJ [Candidatus Peregrinibacteria bacterium]